MNKEYLIEVVKYDCICAVACQAWILHLFIESWNVFSFSSFGFPSMFCEEVWTSWAKPFFLSCPSLSTRLCSRLISVSCLLSHSPTFLSLLFSSWLSFPPSYFTVSIHLYHFNSSLPHQLIPNPPQPRCTEEAAFLFAVFIRPWGREWTFLFLTTPGAPPTLPTAQDPMSSHQTLLCPSSVDPTHRSWEPHFKGWDLLSLGRAWCRQRF